MRILLFSLLFFVSQTAYAQTVDLIISPKYNQNRDTQLTITQVGDLPALLPGDAVISVFYNGGDCGVIGNSFDGEVLHSGSFGDFCDPNNDYGDGLYTYFVLNSGQGGGAPSPFCEAPNTYNDCINSADYLGKEWAIPLILDNPTWGNSNGFWGSTTPTVIANDLKASVQSTGANIWPLLALVGIPMGFLIAFMLIRLINKELTPVQKPVEKKKEDFIYHSADDLEFKREYGKPVKRKRGRPRKNPL